MGAGDGAATTIEREKFPLEAAIDKVQAELRWEVAVCAEHRRELEFLESGGNPLDFDFWANRVLLHQPPSQTDSLTDKLLTSKGDNFYALIAHDPNAGENCRVGEALEIPLRTSNFTERNLNGCNGFQKHIAPKYSADKFEQARCADITKDDLYVNLDHIEEKRVIKENEGSNNMNMTSVLLSIPCNKNIIIDAKQNESSASSRGGFTGDMSNVADKVLLGSSLKALEGKAGQSHERKDPADPEVKTEIPSLHFPKEGPNPASTGFPPACTSGVTNLTGCAHEGITVGITYNENSIKGHHQPSMPSLLHPKGSNELKSSLEVQVQPPEKSLNFLDLSLKRPSRSASQVNDECKTKIKSEVSGDDEISQVLVGNTSNTDYRDADGNALHGVASGAFAIANRAREDAILQAAEKIEHAKRKCMEWARRRTTPNASRPKSHWDYVLQEMAWMANDFMQERLWKVAAAAQTCRWVAQIRFPLEYEETAILERQKRITRILSTAVLGFWNSAQDLLIGGKAGCFKLDKGVGDKDEAVPMDMDISSLPKEAGKRRRDPRVLEEYALRFLKHLSKNDLPQAPLTPERMSENGSRTSWEDISEECLHYVVAAGSFEAYRSSIEKGWTAVQDHALMIEEPNLGSNEFITMLEDFEDPVHSGKEDEDYHFPLVSPDCNGNFVSKKRRNMLQNTTASRGYSQSEQHLRNGSMPADTFHVTGKRSPANNLSHARSGIPIKRMRTSAITARQRAAESPLFTDCAARNNLKRNATKAFNALLDESAGSPQQCGTEKTTYSGGNSNSYMPPKSKKKTNHCSPAEDAKRRNDVANSPSEISNKVLKQNVNGERSKKGKLFKVPGSQPGMPWSTTEDQAILALVHDLDMNWGFVSDVLNGSSQLRGIFRTPKDCREHHKILIEKLCGETDEALDDSGSSQVYSSCLPGVPKGTARNMLQRLHAPMEEDIVRMHLEEIVRVSEERITKKQQTHLPSGQELAPVDPSHLNMLTGLIGVCSPLDFCDQLPAEEITGLPLMHGDEMNICGNVLADTQDMVQNLPTTFPMQWDIQQSSQLAQAPTLEDLQHSWSTAGHQQSGGVSLPSNALDAHDRSLLPSPTTSASLIATTRSLPLPRSGLGVIIPPLSPGLAAVQKLPSGNAALGNQNSFSNQVQSMRRSRESLQALQPGRCMEEEKHVLPHDFQHHTHNIQARSQEAATTGNGNGETIMGTVLQQQQSQHAELKLLQMQQNSQTQISMGNAALMKEHHLQQQQQKRLMQHQHQQQPPLQQQQQQQQQQLLQQNVLSEPYIQQGSLHHHGKAVQEQKVQQQHFIQPLQGQPQRRLAQSLPATLSSPLQAQPLGTQLQAAALHSKIQQKKNQAVQQSQLQTKLAKPNIQSSVPIHNMSHTEEQSPVSEQAVGLQNSQILGSISSQQTQGPRQSFAQAGKTLKQGTNQGMPVQAGFVQTQVQGQPSPMVHQQRIAAHQRLAAQKMQSQTISQSVPPLSSVQAQQYQPHALQQVPSFTQGNRRPQAPIHQVRRVQQRPGDMNSSIQPSESEKPRQCQMLPQAGSMSPHLPPSSIAPLAAGVPLAGPLASTSGAPWKSGQMFPMPTGIYNLTRSSNTMARQPPGMGSPLPLKGVSGTSMSSHGHGLVGQSQNSVQSEAVIQEQIPTVSMTNTRVRTMASSALRPLNVAQKHVPSSMDADDMVDAGTSVMDEEQV